VGDADRFNYQSTVIRYGQGQRGKALLVSSKIQGGAQLQEASGLVGVDLVLITGTGFQGVAAAASSPPADAPTAAPPATEAQRQEAAPPPPAEPAC
jgi:hypothetical protein